MTKTKKKNVKKVIMKPQNRKPLAKLDENSYTFYRNDMKVVITALSRKEAIVKFNRNK